MVAHTVNIAARRADRSRKAEKCGNPEQLANVNMQLSSEAVDAGRYRALQVRAKFIGRKCPETVAHQHYAVKMQEQASHRRMKPINDLSLIK